MRHLSIGILLALAGVTEALAQTITIDGAADDPAAALVQGILDRGAYQLLDRDTVLTATDRITSDVVVLEARVTVEGRIDGEVGVVGGELFIRPRASVPGPIGVISGGVFPSGLAEVGEIIYLDPRIQETVEGPASRRAVTLTRPPRRSALRLPGFFGFGVPTYDRVDGLSLFWSAGLALTGGDTARVSLTGTGAYRTERNRLGGGVELAIRPWSRGLISARVERGTFSSDTWIRGTLENSLAALFVASDARDYFESDAATLTLARTPPPPLIQGEGYFLPRIGVHASRDRSLTTGNPWAFRNDDEWRFNPTIDEGELVSVFGAADAAWLGVTSSFTGSASLEWSPASMGDFEFAQLRSSIAWRMLALYQHRIEVRGYLQLPLGGEEAPLQRWSFVGGAGTLPTFPTATFRGDHVAFVETVYTIPIVHLQLPLVGPPSIRLLHAAGTAWRSGAERPPLEQNLAAGLDLSLLELMVYVDPTESALDPVFKLGGRLPLGAGCQPF